MVVEEKRKGARDRLKDLRRDCGPVVPEAPRRELHPVLRGSG